MKKRRLLRVALAAFTLLSVLSGCAQSGDTADSTGRVRLMVLSS